MSLIEDNRSNMYPAVDDNKHNPFDRKLMHALLEEAGDDWQWKIWRCIPTDHTFDAMYASSGRFAVFLYDGVLYERSQDLKEWDSAGDEEEILQWVLESPPYPEIEPLADLYFYSKGLSTGSSPWLLFQYVIGLAQTSQGMGLNSLMNISTRDAEYLGKALVAYSLLSDITEAYTEMILLLSESVGD